MAQLQPFTASSDGWLLCSRKDGAGARLANLLWTWRLARGAGLRTLCFWPPLPAYYSDASGAEDVLDLATLRATELQDELRVIDGRPGHFVQPRFVTPNPRREHEPLDHAVSADPTCSTATHASVITSTDGPLLRKGEDRSDAIDEARALFARLPLHKRVEHAVDSVAREHDLSRMVAVHVRSGDIVEGLRDACLGFGPEDLRAGSVLDKYTQHYFRGCAPTTSYMSLAERFEGEGYGILFFSDTPSAAGPFQERFAAELLFAASLAPAPLSSVQQALFEIILMSRCHAIVGTKSKFSTLASLIGGAPVLDVRRKATPGDSIAAFRRAAGFDELSPDVREGVSEVVLRQLEQGRFLRRWQVSAEEIRRLLEQAA